MSSNCLAEHLHIIYQVEQAMADMRFFTAQDGRLNIDNYFMSN